MKRRCQNSECFADDGESCAMGLPAFDACPQWTTAPPESGVDPSTSPGAARVPWSGSALGSADLVNLGGRARTVMIGVIGAHDAGKTTLLLGNYLEILRGRPLADATFGGSLTLGAWESLAAWVRFDDAARAPRFPPHTPRGISRVPGLLHLALRNSQDEFRDILLTDAPGEWFSRWTIAEDAGDAEGARWIVKNADGFLVFADCQRLSGPNRGTTRNGLRMLIERLGNHINERPAAFVWAKSDHAPSPEIRDAIRRTLAEHIPHATEVESTTDDPRTVVTALEAALRPAWTPRLSASVVEPVIDHTPFAAFRGIHARS